MNKYLSVNADDFGLTEGTNKAIIYCFKNGIVRSTSIMANGRTFEDAVVLSKENPDLTIGIHLTLVAEKPVLPTSRIPTLVDDQGCLHFDLSEFFSRYTRGLINLNEVRMEVEAQIDKALKSGIKITHLDSHEHVHLRTDIKIMNIAINAAKKYGIQYIRMFSNSDLSKNDKAVSLKRAGIDFADRFYPLYRIGQNTEERLANIIDGLEGGVTEVMCHPAYPDDLYREVYVPRFNKVNFVHMPEEEINALTSTGIKEKIEAAGIKLKGL